MTDRRKEEKEGQAYSPFHPDLDKEFPIDDMFTPENMELVVGGKITPSGWVVNLSGSPTKNSESEMIMGQIVTAAARAGQWIDVPLKSDEPLRKVYFPDGTEVDFSGVMLEFRRGTTLLIVHHLAEIREDDEGRQWLSPTKELCRFIAELLKPFGPKNTSSQPQTQV